jgi:nucleotide-binding universal stress UspA family protein
VRSEAKAAEEQAKKLAEEAKRKAEEEALAAKKKVEDGTVWGAVIVDVIHLFVLLTHASCLFLCVQR